MKLKLLSITLLSLCSANLQAESNFYATAGAAYSQVDKPSDVHDMGYTAGLGYVINPAWSVELSFDRYTNQLGHKPQSFFQPVLDVKNGYQSKGFTLAAVGKTIIAPATTLYYRAGISRQNVHEQVFTVRATSATCANNQAKLLLTIVDSKDNIPAYAFTECSWSDSGLQAVLGLGVDYDFSSQWFGRMEVQHLFEHNASALDSVRISLGYRF